MHSQTNFVDGYTCEWTVWMYQTQGLTFTLNNWSSICIKNFTHCKRHALESFEAEYTVSEFFVVGNKYYEWKMTTQYHFC